MDPSSTSSPRAPRRPAPRPRAAGLRLAAAVSLLWAPLHVGCSTTAQIHSEPQGARVIIDGDEAVGRTPIEIEELAWVWTSHEVLVRKEGYVPKTVALEASFDPTYLAVCVCTLTLLWPLVLVGEYNESIVVQLQPEGARPGAVGQTRQLREQPAISFGELAPR